jgi:hypothetical protein
LFTVSGALCMTLAQRNTWVATAPTIKNGFKIYVTDVGSVTDASGTVHVPGAEAKWTPLGFLWTQPVVYGDVRLSTPTAGAAVVLRTIVVPASVAGSYSNVRLSGLVEFVGGTNTKDISAAINGTNLILFTGLAAGTLTVGVSKSLLGRGPSAQKMGGTGNFVEGANATQAIRNLTINCATTALTGTITTTTTGDTAAVSGAFMTVTDDFTLQS